MQKEIIRIALESQLRALVKGKGQLLQAVFHQQSMRAINQKGPCDTNEEHRIP